MLLLLNGGGSLCWMFSSQEKILMMIHFFVSQVLVGSANEDYINKYNASQANAYFCSIQKNYYSIDWIAITIHKPIGDQHLLRSWFSVFFLYHYLMQSRLRQIQSFFSILFPFDLPALYCESDI